MNYLIQTNLLNNEDLKTLTDALTATGSPVYPVKVIPFLYDYIDGEPTPGFFQTIPVFALGSTTMIKIAGTLGWKPGVFNHQNLRYDVCIEHWKTEMLNHDAEFHRFEEIPSYEGLKFIRPVTDNKAFAGTVIDSVEFETWRSHALQYETNLFPETPILVADPKNIEMEYRFFVVNGEVISGSMYMHKGRLKKRALEAGYSFDAEVMGYAQSMVDQWQPDTMFVLDVAVVDAQAREFKILEINGFNASGFYKTDVFKVITAVNEYFTGVGL